MRTDDSVRTRGDRWLFRVFLVCAALQVIPIVAVRYIPAVDLPNHVYSAVLHTVPADDPRAEFFHADWLPSPYVLFHLLLAPLISLAGYMIAWKTLVVLYVILVPVSAVAFVREFNRGDWLGAFFSFVFIYTFHFEYGFMPFVLGVSVVLLALVFIRRLIFETPSIGTLLVASLLITLAYLSHIINFIAVVIGAVTLLVWQVWHVDKPSGAGPPLRLVARLSAVFVPSAGLALWYLFAIASTGASAASIMSSMQYQPGLGQLLAPIRVFFSIDLVYDCLALAVIGGVVLLLLASKRARLNRGPALALGVVLLTVSLLLPRDSFLGGTDLGSRLAVFGLFSLAASFDVQAVHARAVLTTLMAVFAVSNVALRWEYYSRTSRLTETYVDTVIAKAPVGSRILTTYDGFPSLKLKPLLHSIGWYHIEKGGYSPFMFAGNSSVAGLSVAINPPALSERWKDEDSARLEAVLPFYDYLVATTCRSPLPVALAALRDTIVHQDSVCTIFKLDPR